MYSQIKLIRMIKLKTSKILIDQIILVILRYSPLIYKLAELILMKKFQEKMAIMIKSFMKNLDFMLNKIQTRKCQRWTILNGIVLPKERVQRFKYVILKVFYRIESKNLMIPKSQNILNSFNRSKETIQNQGVFIFRIHINYHTH